MGYDTQFTGSVTVTPPLNAEEVAYLNRFNETRRMMRTQCHYFVEGSGDFGQGHDDADITNYNEPPDGQPGLWCQWVSNADGTEISWDGGEKFYESRSWMAYIIKHFIGPNPKAKVDFPTVFAFLQGHTIEGDIFACGEDAGDLWTLEVRDSVVQETSPKPESTECPECGSFQVETRITGDRFVYGVDEEAVELEATIPVNHCRACECEFLDHVAEQARHEAICRHLSLKAEKAGI